VLTRIAVTHDLLVGRRFPVLFQEGEALVHLDFAAGIVQRRATVYRCTQEKVRRLAPVPYRAGGGSRAAALELITLEPDQNEKDANLRGGAERWRRRIEQNSNFRLLRKL
jgi:hypothetical protein